MDRNGAIFVLWFLLFREGVAIKGLTANKSSTVEILCPFKNRAYDLKWYRNQISTIIIYTINERINPDLHHKERIEVTGDHVNGEFNLLIINLTHGDSGMYCCVNFHERAEFKLKVIEQIAGDENKDAHIPFQFDFVFDVREVRVTFSSYLVSNCEVLTLFPSTNQFFFNETYVTRAVFTGNATANLVSFWLYNLTLNDTGEFTCEVLGIQSFIYLTVYVPLVEVKIFPVNSFLEELRPSIFYCDVRSLPISTISWHKNNSKSFGEETSTVNQITAHSSIIYLAKREDHGQEINCHAYNNLNAVDSAKIFLNITYSPNVIVIPEALSVVEGQKDVNIKCSVVEANPNVVYYIWSKNNSTLRGQTGSTLTLSNIMLGDSGTYGCQGYNGIGNGNTAPSHIYVLPMPKYNVSSVSCNTSSTLVISCTMGEYNNFYSPLYWIHHHNNTDIRSFAGLFDKDVFRLTLEFCNYMDLGLYTCIWKGDKNGVTNVNITTNVIIRGPPIIFSKQVTVDSETMTISVEFYSVPFPMEPAWYHKSELVTFGSKYHRSTLSKTILVRQYGKVVYVNGFVTNLTVLNYDEIYGDLFGCRIENSISFVYEDIPAVSKSYSGQTCSEGTSVSVVAGTAVGCIVMTITVMLGVFITVQKYRHNRKTGKIITKQGVDNIGIEGYEEIGLQNTPNVHDIVGPA